MRVLLFLLTFTLSHAASITGKVVGVHDGDTLTVLTAAKESVKVRLYGIDAPESKQAFGARSKQELSELAFGKQVRVERPLWANRGTHFRGRSRRECGNGEARFRLVVQILREKRQRTRDYGKNGS
jgi:endonuclease YncB( thermonuclease family)